VKTAHITTEQFADFFEVLADVTTTEAPTFIAHDGVHPQLGHVVIIAGTADDAMLITKRAA
jgi:hypothetical protein